MSPTPAYAALVTFALVLVGTPGVNNVLATRSGATVGIRRALPLLLGLVCGVPLAVVASVALFDRVGQVAWLGLTLKVTGTAYLIWLAWHLARSGPPDLNGGREVALRWRTGLTISLLNPKTWTAALTTAVGFAERIPDPVRLAGVGAAAFGFGGMASVFTWATAGQQIGRVLGAQPGRWRLFNGALAVLLVATVPAMWWRG